MAFGYNVYCQVMTNIISSLKNKPECLVNSLQLTSVKGSYFVSAIYITSVICSVQRPHVDCKITASDQRPYVRAGHRSALTLLSIDNAFIVSQMDGRAMPPSGIMWITIF